MTSLELAADALRLNVNPLTLGLTDTSELVQHALPWIGQERAEAAARFGMEIVAARLQLVCLGRGGQWPLDLAGLDDAGASRAAPGATRFVFFEQL